MAEAFKLKDRLWLWGHEAGSHNDGWGLPKISRITPVEAASYMGIPNVIMVRYLGKPSLPFDQYAIPFRRMKQVVWSAIGALGHGDEAEQKHVLELAARHPNITGVIHDDFFAGAFEGTKAGDAAALSLDQLQMLRNQLIVDGRRLDLWAVLYEYQLDKPVAAHLNLLDMVSFWTWDSAMIRDLEARFATLEALAPQCRKVLGCYMWDYGQKKPMPLDLMEHQCTLGLNWLKAGRIEGIIFLASCICDLELEAVESTRKWIDQVGDTSSPIDVK